MIDIERRLALSGSKTIEYKRNLKSLKKIIKTIIAFANTSGGVLIIGVDDQGNTLGLSKQDSILGEEKLANSISDSIYPLVLPEISYINHSGQELLMVNVFPGNNKPYYLKSEGEVKGVYVRIGSTNRQASLEMIAELKRNSLNISFDQELMYEFALEDLDLKYIEELFAEHREITSKANLESLDIIKKDRGKVYPTKGSYILFGKDRSKHFPQAIVRCARFKGTDVEEFLDMQDFEGYPISEIEKIIGFIKRNIRKSASIEGIYRQEEYEYPLVAVREALINAIVHRDYTLAGSDIKIGIYDDRLEIISPGMLPFAVDLAAIKSGVFHLRNKMIGRIFRELGLIEQWGTGIKRIYSECKKQELIEPDFKELGNFFKVTIFNQKNNLISDKEYGYLSSDEKLVLESLSVNEKLVNKDIANILNKSIRTARKVAKKLIEKGYIKEVAQNIYDPNKYYILKQKDAKNKRTW